jgi:hypothetical protein
MRVEIELHAFLTTQLVRDEYRPFHLLGNSPPPTASIIWAIFICVVTRVGRNVDKKRIIPAPDKNPSLANSVYAFHSQALPEIGKFWKGIYIYTKMLNLIK